MNAPLKILLVLLLAVGIASCAPPPRAYRTYAEPQQALEPSKVIATEVYFYPMHGQDSRQQDRDRFECYLWAKRQTGFDPSRPYLAPHQRTVVIPDPAPGHDTAAGAFTGAVLGAVIGSPHNAGEGAVLGAIAGGAIGAMSDAARAEQARYLQERYEQRSLNRDAGVNRQAENYRRALKACLEGRGYSVR